MFTKGFFIALSTLMLAQFSLLSYRASAQGERETIFIGPVKAQDAITESAKRAGRASELAQIQQGLRGQLVTELNQTHVFQIVERERKDDIELEQAFAEVAVNPNDKNRAQSLKMAGAKYAFLPQIDGFEDRRSTVRYDAIARSSHSRSVWISASVSIVDTTTGALLPESPSVKVKSGSSSYYARGGAALGGDELISGLTRELAEKLARESVALIRPAKVLTTSPRILINRGSEADFNVGARVDFYATEDVKDEDTGEIFKNEVKVGEGVIKSSDAKQSYAEVVGENLGIAKGCLAKIATKASSLKGAAAAEGANKAAGAKREDELNSGSGDKPIVFK